MLKHAAFTVYGPGGMEYTSNESVSTPDKIRSQTVEEWNAELTRNKPDESWERALGSPVATPAAPKAPSPAVQPIPTPENQQRINDNRKAQGLPPMEWNPSNPNGTIVKPPQSNDRANKIYDQIQNLQLELRNQDMPQALREQHNRTLSMLEKELYSKQPIDIGGR